MSDLRVPRAVKLWNSEHDDGPAWTSSVGYVVFERWIEGALAGRERPLASCTTEFAANRLVGILTRNAAESAVASFMPIGTMYYWQIVERIDEDGIGGGQ